MTLREVKPERTAWRDEAISLRHRQWGFDCPIVDVDFLVVDYNKAVAVAIIEYKNENAPTQFSGHASYRALRDLANKARLPFLACRYASDFTWWKPVGLNRMARERLRNLRPLMSEADWVGFLYRLRGLRVPSELLADLEVAI